jgi:hypothetical protein
LPNEIAAEAPLDAAKATRATAILVLLWNTLIVDSFNSLTSPQFGKPVERVHVGSTSLGFKGPNQPPPPLSKNLQITKQ